MSRFCLRSSYYLKVFLFSIIFCPSLVLVYMRMTSLVRLLCKYLVSGLLSSLLATNSESACEHAQFTQWSSPKCNRALSTGTNVCGTLVRIDSHTPTNNMGNIFATACSSVDRKKAADMQRILMINKYLETIPFLKQ